MSILRFVFFLAFQIIFFSIQAETYFGEHSFPFTGPQAGYEFTLKGVKNHLIYKYERVAYQCRDANGNEYTCYRNEAVPVEVRDYFIFGDIEMELGPVPMGIIPNEEISVTLNDLKIAVTSKGTKELVVYGEVLDYKLISDIPPKKRFSLYYKISFAPLAPHLKPIMGALSNLEYKNYALDFKVNRVEERISFFPRIKIVRKKLFNDQVIVDRDLHPSEYELIDEGDKTVVVADLARFRRVLDEGGTFIITAIAQVKFQDPKIISTLSTSRSEISSSIKIKL